MKRLFSVFLVLGFCSLAQAQRNTVLEARINEYLKFTNEMNFDKILDYTYPKLFTLAPREDMLEVFKSAYNNEAYTISLDSLKIDSIYPAFKTSEGEFTKIRYSMVMHMKFLQDSLVKAGTTEAESATLQGMKAQFGENNVTLNRASNTLNISVISDMVAIKDSFAKEWCFVNFEKDDPLTAALFSQDIITKIAGYK